MSSTRVYGIVVFEVDKDIDAVMMDMDNVGLTVLEFTDVDPEYLMYLNRAESEFSFVLGKFKSRSIRDYIFEVSEGKVILSRFYMSSRSNVRFVMIVGLRAGILRAVARRLERLGWRKRLMFEIRRTIKSIRYTD